MQLDEELRRVIPVIEGLRAKSKAVISVDTRKADVMKRAASAGANILNDVSALSHDPKSLETAAASGLPVMLMHAQGDPRMAVVEAAADPDPVHPDHVHDAARLRPLRGFLDQPLEDPRVGGISVVLESDKGQGLGHYGSR